jgi:hypothetical protein
MEQHIYVVSPIAPLDEVAAEMASKKSFLTACPQRFASSSAIPRLYLRKILHEGTHQPQFLRAGSQVGRFQRNPLSSTVLSFAIGTHLAKSNA